MNRSECVLSLAMFLVAGALPAQDQLDRSVAPITYPRVRAKTRLTVRYDRTRDTTVVISRINTSSGSWKDRPTFIDTDVAFVYQGRKATREIDTVTIQFMVTVNVLPVYAAETMPLDQFTTIRFLTADSSSASHPLSYTGGSVSPEMVSGTVRKTFRVELGRDEFVRLAQSKRVRGMIGPLDFQWYGGGAMEALRDVAALLNPALIRSASP